MDYPTHRSHLLITPRENDISASHRVWKVHTMLLGTNEAPPRRPTKKQQPGIDSPATRLRQQQAEEEEKQRLQTAHNRETCSNVHVHYIPTMSMRSFFLLFSNLVAVTTAYSVVPSPSALPATFPGDVDLEAAYAASDFCIAPAALILRAKDIITNRGIGLKDGGACLAEDFIFRAQFVEVDRKGFVGALESFNLEDSFVISQSLFGWTVDPTQPNRVWFLNRQEGAFTGSPFQGVAPTGETIVLPPQTYHMDFNTDGQVTAFGFYTADRAYFSLAMNTKNACYRISTKGTY
jgi:hypothetical protein